MKSSLILHILTTGWNANFQYVFQIYFLSLYKSEEYRKKGDCWSHKLHIQYGKAVIIIGDLNATISTFGVMMCYFHEITEIRNKEVIIRTAVKI